MVALLLVAVSLGLSNFAAAVGLGVAGVDRRTRVRVGVTFGIFEAGMPIVGLLIGHGLAADRPRLVRPDPGPTRPGARRGGSGPAPGRGGRAAAGPPVDHRAGAQHR